MLINLSPWNWSHKRRSQEVEVSIHQFLTRWYLYFYCCIYRLASLDLIVFLVYCIPLPCILPDTKNVSQCILCSGQILLISVANGFSWKHTEEEEKTIKTPSGPVSFQRVLVCITLAEYRQVATTHDKTSQIWIVTLLLLYSYLYCQPITVDSVSL